MQSKHNDKDEQQTQALHELDFIREVLVRPTLKADQKQRDEQFHSQVTKVISQAIAEREANDKSVSATLAPVIQENIKTSFASHRAELTEQIFPMVGDLVRKFVAVSLRDFIEKTNQIIENSVSIKGLTWRFQAWRSGMPFAQYVIAQTYVYRVQQVLLIHHETGILLNSVAKDQKEAAQSELVSAMLTAINDFVSDSFTSDERHNEQHLDEIKTDGFTLFVIRGPLVMLVAAVNGNISPNAKAHLQQTLSDIHKSFIVQLRDFSGDADIFLGTTEQLESCLLSEEKIESKQKKKTPIFALLFIALIVASLGYYAFLHFQTNAAANRIAGISNTPGIVPIKIDVQGISDIHINLLRDPSGISVEQWLADANVNQDWLSINEYPFNASGSELVRQQLAGLMSEFPELTLDLANMSLTGSLSMSRNDDLLKLLSFLSISNNIVLNASNIIIKMPLSDEENEAVLQQAFKQFSAEISQMQIDFEIGSAQVSESQQPTVDEIVNRFNIIQALAARLNKNIYLLVIGATDNIGTDSANITLGASRAASVVQMLRVAGVPQVSIVDTSVLPIDTLETQINIRKVIVTVISADSPEANVD